MSNIIEVKVPDIGDYKDVPVIEVLVKPGDQVKAEDPLVTLESDKATMEVPSPAAGVVKDIRIKVGDKVSKGAAVLTLEGGADGDSAAVAPADKPVPGPAKQPESGAPPAAAAPPVPLNPQTVSENLPSPPSHKGETAARGVDRKGGAAAHAGTWVRRYARELGVDLARAKGRDPNGRILREDVQEYVKGDRARARGAEGGGRGFNRPPLQPVDFAKCG